MVWMLLGCGDGEERDAKLSPAELLKPETCKECHPTHYREWSGSMHAYAAKDPIFIAMNQRGQEETQGKLGSFCVGCHAPLAVRDGLTNDGLNLHELPEHYQGITCAFCHSVTDVKGTHNNPLVLSNDSTMRGSLTNPRANPAHNSRYSSWHDRNRPESSALCGACHDIVLPSPPAPKPLALERTFAEWKDTVFNRPAEQGGLGCPNCHMPGRDDVAAEFAGVPLRRVHSHAFVGVDTALIPFPEKATQLEQIRAELDTTLYFEICVRQLPDASVIYVLLENVAAGHSWPSGASQDRRAWVELRAKRQGQTIFESGTEPGPIRDSLDPNLWALGDRVFQQDGKPAHMFWDVAKIESDVLPGAKTFDPKDPEFSRTHKIRRYPKTTASPNLIPGNPDRVELRVRLRAVGLDVLADLEKSGHLDTKALETPPTVTLLPNRASSEFSLLWTEQATADPTQGFKRTIEGSLTECVSSANLAR